MAKRRGYAYGTAPIPQQDQSGMGLPPPPDGKAPARLPIGGEPQQPQAQPPNPMAGDPNDLLIRLLQQLGRV